MLSPSWSDLSMFLEPAHKALGQDVAKKIATADLSTPATVGAKLGELGLFGLVLPPRLGGTVVANTGPDASVDVRALCIVREALAYPSLDGDPARDPDPRVRAHRARGGQRRRVDEGERQDRGRLVGPRWREGL